MSLARFFKFTILAVAVGGGAVARARVFSYKDSGVAAFLRGTGGLSQLAQDQFANGDGGIAVDGSSKYQYSGELGAALNFGNLQVRLGAEAIQHRPVSEGKGTDSAGTQMFTLNSSVFVFNPNVTFEYSYAGSGDMRYYGALGGGYANVTVVNEYKMTGPGTTRFGVTDFDEKMETTVYELHAETGLETLFTDNVTFLAGVGYRHFLVPSLKYKGDANTISNPGGVLKGEPVLNEDGSKRRLNLGGFFASIGFRFYLNF